MTIFAQLSDGLHPLALLDQAFAEVRQEVPLASADFGYVDDPTHDNSSAFTALFAAYPAGCTVVLPNKRVLKTIKHEIPNCYNMRGSGPNSEIYYVPATDDDRYAVFYIHNPLGQFQQTNGPGKGASEIDLVGLTAQDGLAALDWISVERALNQPTFTGIPSYDIVQIKQVIGGELHLCAPMRQAFPSLTDMGIRKIYGGGTNNHRNCKFSDFKITVNNPALNGVALTVIYVVNNLGFTMENLHIDGAQPFATNRVTNFHVRNCRFSNAILSSCEIANSVDFSVINNIWSGGDTPASASAMTLDYSCAYFEIMGNVFNRHSDIALQVIHNTHDGSITHNLFGYVPRETGNAIGLFMRGCQDITFAFNRMVGGDGAASIGVQADADTYTDPAPSQNNLFFMNEIVGFTTDYNSPAATDTYIYSDRAASNRKIVQTGSLAVDIIPGSYTVTQLSGIGGVAGKTVFCSNCRVFDGAGAQETGGNGTGGLVTHNGTAWKIAGTNITAVA